MNQKKLLCNVMSSLWSCLCTLGYSRLNNNNVSDGIHLIQDPEGNVIDKVVTVVYRNNDSFVFQVNSKVGKEHDAYASVKTYNLSNMLVCFQDIVTELNRKYVPPVQSSNKIFVFQDKGSGGFKN